MAAALVLVPFLVLLGLALHGRVRNPLHPALVLSAMLLVLAVLNVSFAEAVRFYPLQASGAGALTLSLVGLLAGALLATLVYPPGTGSPAERLGQVVSARAAWWFGLILFGLFAGSTVIYWVHVANTLGLATVFTAPARLKSAELTGLINPDAPAFFFRNTLLIPVGLTVAAYANPRRWLPKLFLAVYLLVILISVRRSPIMQAFAATLAIASISTVNFRSLLGPLAAGFGVLLAFSLYLLNLFRGLRLPFEALLFGYTAGNLSSFQAVLDGYYPPGPRHPMENTLYIFYSLFKYFDPHYAPQPIIKPNPLQPLLPNTYTFLADFYLDGGIAGLVVFPLLIGGLIGFSYSLAVRRPHYITYVLFAAVYASVSISFLTNPWGWFTIPFSALHAAILWMVLLVPCEAVVRLFRSGRGASDGATEGPRFGTA